MQLPASVVQLACDVTSPNSVNNVINNQAIIIPRASSVQISCALFIGSASVAGNLVSDLSNILTANLVIRQGSAATGTVLVQYVLTAAQLNAGLTYAQWAANTAAHFVFTLTPTDTNQAAGPIFVAVGVTTTNAGDVSCAFSSTAKVVDYGIFNPGAPTAPDYTSWSKAESDRRYVQAAANSGSFAPAVTSVGTGAAGSLETLVTAPLTLPVLQTIYAGGSLQDWLLVAGTDNNDSTHRQPNDFDSSMNARVWVRQR